ncbi:uroporphyrinogen decarboxylase family protein [Sporomusa termitida]|uniref:Uroporphyrinogen decarboxylase (URO-D) n=1 Tax=Sporomusa termitida TaxID=2377 RepID=A0A517DYG4_9FIRM|nr:uroporphyrinogen decarboxylase family protein [Sporomusa termitida]QDR82286.1 Uroporphyrinogen decarboxylase (URO-D) [Sporomusa termitida]
MSLEMQKLYDERLGRYQATIALEPTDRIPIASGSCYLAEVYSGATNQEIIYDPDKWLQAEMAFIKDFPEIDTLRDNRVWAPLYDAVGCKTYKLPGRDLPPNQHFQFVEEEYMQADEYELLIQDPGLFMLNKFLPRVLGEYGSPDANRSHMAFLKAGMGQMMMNNIMRNRSLQLQTVCGMPQPTTGVFIAPFDVLGDVLRGLRGALMDTYRRPRQVLEACDVLVDVMVRFALSTADPLRRYPIFVPTHKACFMSPKQFDTFYWPSFKRVLEKLIAAGYTVRAYLEGDWKQHWHHFNELPQGKVLCDIDTQGDIFKAKADFGRQQAISGGIHDSTFILGTPAEVAERVHHLCETVGKGGGFIINGGCNIPYDTKPENFRAMIDTIMQYGWYDKNCKPVPKPPAAAASAPDDIARQYRITPWATRVKELGGVRGDEAMIQQPWDQLEAMAFNWLWTWTM